MNTTDSHILDWMRRRAEEARSRRPWAQLPPDFEAVAVTSVFMDIKPHFSRQDVRRRIQASKALTFSDLLDALQ